MNCRELCSAGVLILKKNSGCCTSECIVTSLIHKSHSTICAPDSQDTCETLLRLYHVLVSSAAASAPWGRQVVREFRLPEGASAADLDAATDPDSGLLVVLDLREDDSLQTAGLVREVHALLAKHSRAHCD